MGYAVDQNRMIDLIKRFDFPRVVGTDGEQHGFQLLKETVELLGLCAWFEEFPTPWIEVDEAYLQVGRKRLPLEPLANPLFNGPWIPIPYAVDREGILVDSMDSAIEKQILLRTSLDIAEPCVAGASAQVFACPPEEGFVAYYLADVSGSGNLVPSAYLKPKALPLLKEHLGTRCRIRWTSTRLEKTLRNLVAEVRGTERPEKVIAVGAHFDSFPGTVGANDNASGCVRLVEFARWFVAHPPARTVRFIWFTGEELDLRGSHAYVTAHLNDAQKIRLFVNVDGGVSRDHERLAIDVENQAAVARAAGQCLEGIIDPANHALFRRMARSPAGSDAAPFHKMGIPALFAPGTGKRKNQGPSPHLPTDTVDQLDPECLLTASVVALAFIDAAQRHGLAVHPPML